jgi:hypothetical protein
MASQSRSSRPQVQSIGSLVSQLISRRGYAQSGVTNQFEQIIRGVLGPGLAKEITVGKLNRGVLKVFAGDSVTVQELMFQKRTLVRRIQAEMPDAKLTDIRFEVLQR